MYQRFLKLLKCIDIIIIFAWITYCGIYIGFPSLDEKLRSLLFPVALILLADFALVDFFEIYMPLHKHLKEYSIRGLLVAIPMMIFYFFT